MSTLELLAEWLEKCGSLHGGACYSGCLAAALMLEVENADCSPDCCGLMASVFAEHLKAELAVGLYKGVRKNVPEDTVR